MVFCMLLNKDLEFFCSNFVVLYVYWLGCWYGLFWCCWFLVLYWNGLVIFVLKVEDWCGCVVVWLCGWFYIWYVWVLFWYCKFWIVMGINYEVFCVFLDVFMFWDCIVNLFGIGIYEYLCYCVLVILVVGVVWFC